MTLGAHGKYTPEMVAEIIKHLEVGHTDKDACALAGISQDTFYEWIKVHPEFSEAVKKARITAKDQCIKVVRKAAITSWQAGAWFLERKYRDEFALRQELTGEGGNPIRVITVKSEPPAE